MKSYLSIFLLFALSYSLAAQKKNIPRPVQPEKAALYEWKQFDGNRVNANISSDGPYADYRKTSSAGLEWPKGSGKTAVFTSGIWFIGKHRPSESLRAAVQYYTSDFQPGPIISTFNTTTNDQSSAANPNDKKYRIYKINKGDNELNSIDYAEWPGDLGAPFVDLNHNGTWDKGIDKPKLYGDQTLWCVYNDADLLKHKNTGATKPMGIKVQATYFGYDHTGYLGDVMFMKWKVINKSDADYDSVYVGLWSDTDLGNANDDIAGCDTLRNLSYTYNGDNNDAGSNGYGSRPSADGFVYLQGPQVASPNDSGMVNGVYKKGIKNLNAAAHVVYISGGTWSDPPLGQPIFAMQIFNYMRGLIGSSGKPFIDPQTGLVSKFVFPGDPVTGTGWLQSTSGVNPDDMRSMISSGPFTLAKGETQEIVGAFVIARGTDRLNSVTELRATTDLAKSIYKNNYRNMPMANAVVQSFDDTSAAILFTTTSENIPGYIGKIYVHGGNSIPEQKYFLVDDGTNGDSTANDDIYSYTFTVPLSHDNYYIDLTQYGENINVRWDNAASFRTNIIRIIDPVIYSDNLNNDGTVNPGETIRFGISLRNPTTTTVRKIKISTDVNTTSNVLSFPLLPPRDTVSTAYQQNVPSSYLSFVVPVNYALPKYMVYCTLSDSNINQWNDSIVFPVVPIQQNAPIVQQTKGKTSGTFVVIVTDKSKIKDHTYILYGIDSLNSPTFNTFGLKDSTTGTILAERMAPSTGFNTSPALPEFDGFKVIANGITTTPKTVLIYSGVHTDAWFTAAPFVDTIGGSSIHHYTEIPDVLMKFSAKTGYADTNGNHQYDQNEKYFYDSTNASRSQRAYFYRQENILSTTMHYVGFLPIPFTAYEMNGSSLRQLAVVINDRNRNNQWDLSISAITQTQENTVYILSDPYDPDGKQYDSTKGGIDLSSAIRFNSNIPYLYRIGFGNNAVNIKFGGREIEFLSDGGDLLLKYLHPFSSRDEFVFNPTILTGIRSETETPASFALEQNYPNPFNPSTTIRYSIPVRSNVTLSIFNVLGQRVRTLADDVRDAGNYSVVWNGKDYANRAVASGIFFYQIQTESFRSTRKMLLLK